ncbi:MAG TPA: hypothetical protein DIU15_20255 [Deltaproteobacteria bacterium]|nr:hypothetical protein [Deltaproteobacteria bacterium]HCP48382.1 hypothetical protein [Deltaproteobacteria bacterium]|tara:strand:- start:1495 stop:2145 length:651 start_codon:yes stop_codon:yes gene_type:complete
MGTNRFHQCRLSAPPFVALLSFLLLLGCEDCPVAADDDDTLPLPEECSEEDLFVAEACNDQVFCGDPIVRVGTGGSEFQMVLDDADMPIWYGTQGGYHVFFSAEMENLCPVVFLRIKMYLDPGDGELVLLHDQERHVQAVRIEPEVSSRQWYWGINGFLPCEYWPNDPNNSPNCPEGSGSQGHLEDYEIVMEIEAEDHNQRIAIDQKRVQPFCCNE